MKPEIDLRTPEFKAKSRPLGAALAKKLMVALCCLLLAGFAYSAYTYNSYLKRQLATETTAVQELRKEVKPVIELTKQSALLKARSGLEQDLLSSAKPIQDYLLFVRQLAADYNLELELAAVDRKGNLLARGLSFDLQELASFNCALEEQPQVLSSEITALSLGHEGGYHFELIATGHDLGGLSE